MADSKLAVIGDIHSNSLAFHAALSSIFKYESQVSPIDHIVLMGDLLTYGVRPKEIICEILELSCLRSVTLLQGNHDLLYSNLIDGNDLSYYENLPSWLKESVDYNLSNFDHQLFRSLEFVPYLNWFNILFSHANFSSISTSLPDWSYVNTPEEYSRQLQILASHQCHFGVLGHTHRSRLYTSTSDIHNNPVCLHDNSSLSNKCFLFDQESYFIANAGSIGQPRERSFSYPSWLLIDIEASVASSVEFMSFEYDYSLHLDDISKSGLSSTCVHKLLTFFS